MVPMSRCGVRSHSPTHSHPSQKSLNRRVALLFLLLTFTFDCAILLVGCLKLHVGCFLLLLNPYYYCLLVCHFHLMAACLNHLLLAVKWLLLLLVPTIKYHVSSYFRRIRIYAGFVCFHENGIPGLSPEVCACAVSHKSAGKPVGCLK